MPSRDGAAHRECMRAVGDARDWSNVGAAPSAVHRDVEYFAVPIEFHCQDVVSRFFVDRVVEYGGQVVGTGVETDALELERVEQMFNGQIVRILDTKDLEQILVAQLFRVVAEVRGDRAFRPLGVLRLESVTRDFIEAHRVGDEYPDFVEHGRGERILPFDVDVHPHIATAHRQVELPVATGSIRKLRGPDDGNVQSWHGTRYYGRHERTA